MFGKLLLFTTTLNSLTPSSKTPSSKTPSSKTPSSKTCFNPSSDVSIYTSESNIYIMEYLKKINEGQRIINDMCETLDEKYSIISGSNKPSCDYNISYINNTEIVIYSVNKKIKQFFVDEKKVFCKKEQIECGELTIILKLLDLINSGIKVSINNVNFNELMLNLKLIDFDALFDLYKSSLFNDEIIVNITLSKQKTNVILTKEKTRLYSDLNKISFDKFTDNINTWIGKPLKNTFIYGADVISETVESVIPELSLDVKIIIILVLFLLLKQKC
jgi:hypothetical protein